MPKDEFDFDDPLELNGVGIVCEEDTTGAMTECFIEEYMRLGYNAKQILALFRNPNYIGMHMVVENRGEQFVRDYIAEVFARWGRPVRWAVVNTATLQPAAEEASPSTDGGTRDGGDGPSGRPTLTDPMGAPPPDLKI